MVNEVCDATSTTATVASDIGRMLMRELDCFGREVDMFPDDDSLWKVAPGFTNSVGTLALHVAGNLRGMIGAVLGKSGYVRDRAAEFSRRGLTRKDVKAELDRARKEIEPVIRNLDDSAVAAKWPADFHGLTMPTGRFLIALEVHTAFHLGQAVCARRVVTGDMRSSHPIDTEPLSGV
jgi:hypothetical protein